MVMEGAPPGPVPEGPMGPGLRDSLPDTGHMGTRAALSIPKWSVPWVCRSSPFHGSFHYNSSFFPSPGNGGSHSAPDPRELPATG